MRRVFRRIADAVVARLFLFLLESEACCFVRGLWYRVCRVGVVDSEDGEADDRQ